MAIVMTMFMSFSLISLVHNRLTQCPAFQQAYRTGAIIDSFHPET
jgi:hypothetical protein